MGAVLGDDADFQQVGIEAVGQGEIDDAPVAAEIDGGFGAPVGHFVQAAAASAGEYQHQRAVGDVGVVQHAACVVGGIRRVGIAHNSLLGGRSGRTGTTQPENGFRQIKRDFRKDGAAFQAALLRAAGRGVGIQFLKRILRHKTAGARRKREPMPSIGDGFSTRQMPFYSKPK